MTPRIHYRAGYRYQLAESYEVHVGIAPSATIEHPFFRLTVVGWLTIQAGYAWDGASGPAIDTPSFMRGSLVHDVCYQAMSLGLLAVEWREAADQLLRRLCREDGMSRLRAWWVYRAVRWFGDDALARGPKPVEMAP